MTCKKISCYMPDSACGWFIIENDTMFQMLNIFEFSHMRKVVKS